LILKKVLYWVVDFALLTIVWASKKGIYDANGQEKWVVLKLDVMGDYVLMRPFLRALKEKKPQLHITLICNSVNAELAQLLDGDVVDEFVWVESRGKFLTNIRYRWGILKQIAKIEADVLFHPTENRISRTESIVKLIAAKVKIGVKRSDVLLSTDKLYTKLLSADHHLFEFERQRGYFSNATGLDFCDVEIKGSIRPTKQGNNAKTLGKVSGAYAMLFIGAGFAKREWPPEHFGNLAADLHEKKRLRVLIAGTVRDAAKAARVKKVLPAAEDLTKMKLPMADVLSLMADARLIVSNESGPVHLAAGLGVPCVSISNGNHFGWYSPYPTDYGLPLTTVLHPTVQALLPIQQAEAERIYGPGSNLPMGEITLAEVQAAVDKLLS
jgi:heptosyltransferase-1